MRFLIHDRDSKFSAAFEEILRSEGINVIQTPIRAPTSQRLRRTFRPDRPRRVSRPAADHRSPPPRARIRSHTVHYNRERPHRGLALLTPEATDATDPPTAGTIERRDRLGGLIHEYHRSAA
jgi:putative transposase